MEALRTSWESLPPPTIFQRFDLNRLAAQIFSGQPPVVVKAETDSGLAIIPACLDLEKKCLTLLGEEMFDYRCALAQGDPAALGECWRVLAEFAADNDLGFGFHSLPQSLAAWAETCDIPLVPFTAAPFIPSADLAAFHHPRLALNLRRLQRAGVLLAQDNGRVSSAVKEILARKSLEPGSLFTDPKRLEMVCAMAETLDEDCQVFTLRTRDALVAALISFRDKDWRRFYTTYYDEAWAKFSPGLSLLHDVVRQSLEQGLDCDFMTGEQPYKTRLATRSRPLQRVNLTAEQMCTIAGRALRQTA